MTKRQSRKDRKLLRRRRFEKFPRCDKQLIALEMLYNFRKKRLLRGLLQFNVEDFEENQGFGGARRDRTVDLYNAIVLYF
jgi:hypothetical protein